MSRGIFPPILSDFQHGTPTSATLYSWTAPWQGYVSIWGIRAPECQPRFRWASVCGGSSAAIVTDGESLGTDGADCAKASRRGQVLEKNAVSWAVVLINPKVVVQIQWPPLYRLEREAQCCVPIRRYESAKLKANLALEGSYSRIPRDSVWYDRVIYVPEIWALT